MAASFQLKHFEVRHERSAMKVGTDAFVLGSWLQVGRGVKLILDVGTGCGIIALMLAQKTTAQIDAIDIDEPSIDEATLNFENSPWKKQLKAIHSSIQDFDPYPEKKYDLIVSNPPFFNHSLLPESERLKLAKHTTNFSMELFMEKSYKILGDNGKLAVILPVEEAADFQFLPIRKGFFEFGTLEVYPRYGKPVNRKVLVFSKFKVQNPKAESLLIKDEAGNYTDQYKLLTRDFHGEGYL